MSERIVYEVGDWRKRRKHRWRVDVYDGEGWIEVRDYSLLNTAKREADYRANNTHTPTAARVRDGWAT